MTLLIVAIPIGLDVSRDYGLLTCGYAVTCPAEYKEVRHSPDIAITIDLFHTQQLQPIFSTGFKKILWILYMAPM